MWSENFKMFVGAVALFIPISIWMYYDTKKDLENCNNIMHKIADNQNVLATNQEAITQRLYRNDPVVIPDTRYKAPVPSSPFIKIVNTRQKIKYERLDIFCLAKNIYHEAAVEGNLGMYAVGQVTLNRMKHKDYPSSVCDVVMQWKQFSWANKKSLRWTQGKGPNWRKAKKIEKKLFLMEEELKV